MTSPVRYLIAQHTADLMKKEPRNLGVLVVKEGQTSARFLGEITPGRIDGRKTAGMSAPEVYAQWVDHWRRELTGGTDLEALVQDETDHYRLIRGGQMVHTGEDSADEIADFLFTRLVTGDFAMAMEEAERRGVDKMGEPSEPGLPAEIEQEFLTRHLLQGVEPDVFVMVPYPIIRHRPLTGKSGVRYEPDFVQENGQRDVMEAVDLTRRPTKYLRDHSSAVAYMFKDIEAVERASAIAIVRCTPEARENHLIQESLWVLEAEARVVNWLEPMERQEFLREREAVAKG